MEELIKLPTNTAVSTEVILLIEPIIAAPKPAIAPKGCIAIALMLPNKMPMQKNAQNSKETNCHIGGTPPETKHEAVNTAENSNHPNIAHVHNFRIPKRITNVPLIKDASPMENANIAKYIGNNSPVS